MHDLLRNATTQPLRKRLFAFFRRHVLFCMGNAGWRRKVWKGFEPIGSQEEFTWMLRERQVAMMWINEAYTTIVSVYYAGGYALRVYMYTRQQRCY